MPVRVDEVLDRIGTERCQRIHNPGARDEKAAVDKGVEWGMLFGSAFFAIPGIGPILVAGPLVAWIVGALEGAAVVGGLSAVGAGLIGIGIPKDSVVQYELALKTDQYLLVVRDAASQVARARDIIGTTRPINSTMHSTGIAEVGAR